MAVFLKIMDVIVGTACVLCLASDAYFIVFVDSQRSRRISHFIRICGWVAFLIWYVYR